MMLCKKCGRELPGNAAFCGACGERAENGGVSNPAPMERSQSWATKNAFDAHIWLSVASVMLTVLAAGFFVFLTRSLVGFGVVAIILGSVAMLLALTGFLFEFTKRPKPLSAQFIIKALVFFESLITMVIYIITTALVA